MKRIFRKALRQITELSPSPSQKPLLKDSCQELTAEEFFRCMIDGDLTILGEGTPDELRSAWERMRTHYATVRGDKTYAGLVRLKRDIEVLEVKLALIQLNVDLMNDTYMPVFGEMLANEGLYYETWEYGTEQYVKQLKEVVILSKQWVVERDLKWAQWDEQQKKAGNVEMSWEWLYDSLIILSEDAKYNIQASQISAFEFARMQARYDMKHRPKGRKR